MGTERATVRELLNFDRDALTGKIADVIAALAAVRDLAPEEHRDAVEIEVEAESPYADAGDLVVTVFYDRPETDAEMNSRADWEEHKRLSELSKEREQYERLKAKFG